MRPRSTPHPPKNRNRLRHRQLNSADFLQFRSGTNQFEVDLIADAEGKCVAVWVPERYSACPWWIGRPENHRASSQLLPRAQQPDNLPVTRDNY